MDGLWTVGKTMKWTEGYLAEKGIPEPRVSAQWLMSDATGLTRVELFMQLERPLSPEERARMREHVRRRATGEPLQYITGETWFRHIPVKTAPGVLIPRPETEVLVSEVLALLPPRAVEAAGLPFFAREAARAAAGAAGVADADGAGAGEGNADPADGSEAGPLALDLCTGSGCIACSLAYERPDLRVFATDIAPSAVALARQNAAVLGLEGRVEVVQCDLGAGVDPQLMGGIDLVVSNPPYVPTAVLADIPREVADFEPALALDGGADGLDLFRRVLDFAARALKPGGAFAVELHETCLDEAAALARAAGFVDVRIAFDLASRPRILTARAK